RAPPVRRPRCTRGPGRVLRPARCSRVLLQRPQPRDHRLDPRACLLVLQQQLRAFAHQLFLLLAQAAVLVRQALATVGQRLDPRGEGAEAGIGIGRGFHDGHDRQRPARRSSGLAGAWAARREAARAAGGGEGADRALVHLPPTSRPCLDMSQLPTPEEVAAASRELGLATPAAELHGALCGWLAGGGADVPDWTARVMADADLPPPAADSALDRLRKATAAQLEDGEFAFQLLLAEDDAGVRPRAQALFAWCRGFLGAFGLAAGAQPPL